MSRVWWDDPEEGDNFYRWEDGSCKIIEPYEAVSYLNDLQKDNERLEWLAMSNARIWLQDGWYDIHDNGGTCIVHMKDNWREAIDEAMESER
jgi:hypothetical protein